MEETKNKQEKIRKVFLEGLVKRGKFINWKESIGNKIHFIYDNIEDDLQIIDYNLKTTTLTIRYNELDFEIKTGHFTKCGLGSILKKKTSDFKIELGQTFKDYKRDIIITDRKRIKDKRGQFFKHYKYKCNKCGFNCDEHWSIKDKEYKDELWIVESSLERGSGCSCCCPSPQIVVRDINSIYSDSKWMVSYIKNIEDCYNHTNNSSDNIEVICQDCGEGKIIKISSIYINHSIGCKCSDKQPYPEKFMHDALSQLNIKFTTQLTKTTFKWCNSYRYDFYFELNGECYIIETHGLQHYKESGQGRTLKQEIKNDKLKKELALSNGIKPKNYIVIDCRKSELEWIKNNENGILNSRLNELFNLSKIDWLKCEEFALSNLVKLVCDIKRENNYSVSQLSNIFEYDRTTIRNWLKNGTKFSWCYYNSEEEKIKSGIKNGKSNNKKVEIFKYGISLGIFESASELERKSEKLFGIKLDHSPISRVCLGNSEQYKGFTFSHI